MGRLFVPLGRECPQKGKVVSSLKPWTRKRWCLTPYFGHLGSPTRWPSLCFGFCTRKKTCHLASESLKKTTSKSSLKTGAVKVSLFCFLAPFLHPFGALMGRLSYLWGVGSLKEARFSRAWGPWTHKRWCLVSSGATYRVFLNRSGA